MLSETILKKLLVLRITEGKKKMSMRRWITAVVSLALVAALVPVAVFVQPQVAEAAAKPTVTVTRATTGAVTMKVGSTYKLKAKASSGAALTYKSSKKKVVTVTKKGVLKAKKVGKATVTVTAKKGSKTAKKKIKVTVVKAKKYKKVTSITVKAKKKTLTVGETTTLSVTFNPKKASNKNLIFKSANPKIASVDEQGNVTALKGGRSARILVTSCDNAKAKKWVEILVNEARVTPAEDFEYAVGDFIYEGTVCTGDVDNLPPTLVDEDCLSATVFRDEYGTSFTAQGVKAPALSLEERLQEDYSGRISGGANGSQGPSGGRLTTYDCGYGVYITGYTGTDGNIVIPDKIDGVEVVGVCLEHYVNEVNYYESVDLSRCSSLKAFECVGSVGKLNFGSSSSLVDIWLGYGSFGVLDFSSLPNLEKLVLGTGVGYSSWVMGDKVKCLELWLPGDVSFGQKSELESLTVYGAPASMLSEVRSLLKLRKLTLSGRGEAYSEELTFSYNPLLTYLSLSGYSGISQIDISCNQELQSLDLGDIDISQLCFPQASQLRDLALRECASIESLDFSGCSLLENLSIKYCDNLSDVTVSGLPSLKSLEYSSNAEAENPLRSLNASDCVMLETVDITARETIFYKGIMPSEKVLDFPVDCNTLTGSVNL